MDEYAAFYEEHKGQLFAYLMRMTGDYYLSSDIMQESFTRFLERYGQETRNASLLYTIARNLIVDGGRRRRHNVQFKEDQGDCSINQEHVLMVREEYRRVLLAMEQLTKDERDVLALVVTGELSYREIGSILGISEANVKVKIHRARLKLRKILQEGEV